MQGQVDTSAPAAKSIYQTWLDATAEPALSGDAAQLLDYVNLPYLYLMENTHAIVETPQELEQLASDFSNKLKSLKVNKYIRLVTDAEFLSASYIEGRHITHALCNSSYVLPSYNNRMVLRRSHRSWRMTEIATSVPNSPWPVKSAQSDMEQPLPPRSDPDDPRRKDKDPLAIYQRFLNMLTQMNLRGDFDGYCGLCAFPYSWHTAGSDQIMHSPEDVRPFFEGFQSYLLENDIDEFLRIADSAEFLSSDILCGYHTSRFLHEARDVVQPVKARVILKRRSAYWVMHSITNAISNTLSPSGAPYAPAALVTQNEIKKRMKKWPSLH